MQIAEIYSSKQGEGLLTGQPSVFVRTSGCNLRCSFCDTPFTSWKPEGGQLSLDEIIETIDRWPDQHVVITGGEPMLQREIVELTERLKKGGRHITIETAGTLVQPVQCDLMSISPKLSNSTPDWGRAGDWAARHEASRINLEVLAKLVSEFEYQLKFVVADPADLPEIESLLERLPGIRTDRVLLMPEGITTEVLCAREVWLKPLCDSRGFRFCPRMHIQWYGNKRGT